MRLSCIHFRGYSLCSHPLSGDAFSVYSTCASTPISLPFSFSRKGAKYRKEAVFHCFDFVFPLEGGRTSRTSLPANCFREYFFIVSRKGAKYCSCFSERIFVGNIIFPYICEVFEMMSFNLGVPDLNALSFLKNMFQQARNDTPRLLRE